MRCGGLRKLVLLVLGMVAVAPFWAPTAQAASGVMVWRLSGSEEVTEKDIKVISSYLTTQVARLSGQKVISEEDLKTIISQVEIRQKCGSTDTSCITEIGNALGVPEAIAGELGKLGSHWIISVRRLDLRSAEVIKRVGRDVQGSVDNLIALLPAMVAELFGVVPPPADETNGRPEAAENRSKAMKVAGYTTLSVGLAAVLLPGVLGTVLAKKEADHYHDAASAAALNDAKKKNKRDSTMALVGYAAGGSLLLTGVTLLVVDAVQSRKTAPPLSAFISPAADGRGGILAIGGRF